MTATYELGPHDAESLLSEGEELYILSKRTGQSRLYHATFEERSDATFTLIEEFNWAGRIPKGNAFLPTAADYTNNPPRIVIRGYFAIVEMFGEEGDDIPAIIKRGNSRELPGNMLDFQGEAISYGPGGFYHLPEFVGAPIRYSGCEVGRTPTCEEWLP